MLGGTRFLSRRISVEAARAGHEVICAARGVRGRPADSAAFVRWDRADPAPVELESLQPDVVVDVTSTPAFAARAVATWPRAYWVFISTVNVYADVATAGGSVSDTALVVPWAPGEPADYGREKAACEDMIRTQVASALILRPGLIVGPGDPSGRFTYWPRHAADAILDGGGLLVPGAPDDPVQFIDVGDLAAWVVAAVETRLEGTFDAIGPSMTRAEFMAGLSEGVGADLAQVYVPSVRLAERGIAEWMDPRSIPLWISDPRSQGLMARDVSASLDAGLTLRLVADTVRETLAWLQSTPGAVVTGLTRAEERELLAREHS